MKTIISYLIAGIKEVGVQMIGIIIACISIFVWLAFSLTAGVATAVLLLGLCWIIDTKLEKKKETGQPPPDET